MRKSPGAVLVAWTVVFVCTAPMVAHTNTGNIYGTVIDESGSPVPGGLAALSGPASPRTASVDANGLFRFARVPAGKYAITLSTPGFATVTREGVLVLSGQNVRVEIPLRLAAINEEVTVTGAPALVDTGTVATGRTFAG